MLSADVWILGASMTKFHALRDKGLIDSAPTRRSPRTTTAA